MNDKFYEKILCKHLNSLEKSDYVIYGTKDVAMIYYRFISEKFGENSIAFFIDGKKNTDTFMGKSVYHCNELKDKNVNDYKYIIGTISKIPLFINNLKEVGVKQEQIIEAIHYFSPFYLSYEFSEIKNIYLYPKLEAKDELETVVTNISNYLVVPSDSDKKILIYADPGLEIKLPYGYELITKVPACKGTDEIMLVWNATHLLDKEIDTIENIYCCDDNIVRHLNSSMFAAISSKFYNSESDEYYKKLSKENYKKLIKTCTSLSNAIVCGTGPSLIESFEEHKNKFLTSSIIVCNGFFKVSEVASKISPQLYVLFDHDFLAPRHKEDLDNIIAYILEKDMLLCINLRWLPILLAKYPMMRDRIIGLEPETNCNVFPNEDRLVYLAIENVITSICLPMASGLSDDIFITGCDGLKNNALTHAHEELDGTGNKAKRYLSPNYGNTLVGYFDTVNQNYKRIFEYGESIGKSYRSLAHSNIPELEKRHFSKK